MPSIEPLTGSTNATLQAVNEAVVRAAVALGLEDGKKLRADTTVVETDIHHPTDNTLLWDSVRVEPPGRASDGTAAGRYLWIYQPDPLWLTPHAGDPTDDLQGTGLSEVGKYRLLIGITEQVVADAGREPRRLRGVGSGVAYGQNHPVAAPGNRTLRWAGHRVIDQSRRRALEGESVANAQKVFNF